MPVVKPLTEEQKRFVDAYLRTLSPTNAYIEAYGDVKQPYQAAWQLLKQPTIAQYVEQRFAELSKDRGLTVQKVLDGLANVAFLDVRKLVGEDGELLPLDRLPEDVATAIGGVKVTERYLGSGDNEQRVVTHEYKLTDRNPALTNLGRYFKMFVDVQQHDVRLGLGERMKQAKEKARKIREMRQQEASNG